MDKAKSLVFNLSFLLGVAAGALVLPKVLKARG